MQLLTANRIRRIVALNACAIGVALLAADKIAEISINQPKDLFPESITSLKDGTIILGSGDDIGGTVAVTAGTLVVAADLHAGALAIADGATVILSSTGAALAGNAFGENLDAPFNESATAAVPEPGSATLLFGGALALLGLRRRVQF